MIIQIQDLESIPTNKGLAIRQAPISASCVETSKIPRFGGKKFKSTKMNDAIETRINQKANDNTNELGDILKKASQQNPNSRSYPLRRRQKQK